MTERQYNAAADFVDRHVHEGRGGKTAFIDPSRNITYAEMLDEAARVGPMLARLGVERENRAGIVPVLLNTRLNAEQYRQLFEDSRAKAVFVSAALLPVVREAADGLPDMKAVVVAGGGPDGVLRLDRKSTRLNSSH